MTRQNYLIYSVCVFENWSEFSRCVEGCTTPDDRRLESSRRVVRRGGGGDDDDDDDASNGVLARRGSVPAAPVERVDGGVWTASAQAAHARAQTERWDGDVRGAVGASGVDRTVWRSDVSVAGETPAAGDDAEVRAGDVFDRRARRRRETRVGFGRREEA